MKYKLVYILIFMSHVLYAQTLKITDVKDKSIIVDDVEIYYTSKHGHSLAIFHRADIEYNGIRAEQGMGTLIVEWTKISKITFLLNDKNEAKVTLKTGKVLTVIPKQVSHDGLAGQTDVGEFSIEFKYIKSILTIDSDNVKQQ